MTAAVAALGHDITHDGSHGSQRLYRPLPVASSSIASTLALDTRLHGLLPFPGIIARSLIAGLLPSAALPRRLELVRPGVLRRFPLDPVPLVSTTPSGFIHRKRAGWEGASSSQSALSEVIRYRRGSTLRCADSAAFAVGCSEQTTRRARRVMRCPASHRIDVARPGSERSTASVRRPVTRIARDERPARDRSRPPTTYTLSGVCGARMPASACSTSPDAGGLAFSPIENPTRRYI